MPKLRTLPAYQALEKHRERTKNQTLKSLFAEDQKRGSRLHAEAEGLYLDYSKARVTDETLTLLQDLAKQTNVLQKRDSMFAGEKINATENRPVLHVALRAPVGSTITVDEENVVPEVHAVLDRMKAFSDKVRGGEWLGHTGKRIEAVVNIGIGGSDLGPVMAYEALKFYSQRDLAFRFVSNVGRHRLRRSNPRPRPRDHPLHRLLQNLHHPGDHDQRELRPRVVPRQTQR